MNEFLSVCFGAQSLFIALIFWGKDDTNLAVILLAIISATFSIHARLDERGR